ncbi:MULTISPECIES: hypothetical protein [unclassified Acinetobacter]|uniref:hypothetical protein n=1 Tax=unclassified Acinetobacter TaxID=196816 RepID=UPI0035B98D21
MSDKKLLTVQVDSDLLEQFKRVCDSKDLTASQVIRQFMRDFLAKNKQPDMFK